MGDKLTWAILMGFAGTTIGACIAGYFSLRSSKLSNTVAFRKVEIELEQNLSVRERQLSTEYQIERDRCKSELATEQAKSRLLEDDISKRDKTINQQADEIRYLKRSILRIKSGDKSEEPEIKDSKEFEGEL